MARDKVTQNMTSVLLGVMIFLFRIIAYFLYQIREYLRESSESFRIELKGYLLDIYAEMIKCHK